MSPAPDRPCLRPTRRPLTKSRSLPPLKKGVRGIAFAPATRTQLRAEANPPRQSSPLRLRATHGAAPFSKGANPSAGQSAKLRGYAVTQRA
ncbi:hypothetical protein GLA29479_986 [Lysobacter antibioticus]|nr:hypothetical protein GLA29479_986 [Lysobacter antibioticus]